VHDELGIMLIFDELLFLYACMSIIVSMFCFVCQIYNVCYCFGCQIYNLCYLLHYVLTHTKIQGAYITCFVGNIYLEILMILLVKLVFVLGILNTNLTSKITLSFSLFPCLDLNFIYQLLRFSLRGMRL
jgi:hypothetical protein